MEAEGWGKLREAVTGSEAEGLYGLLRGVISSSHHLSSLSFPSQTRVSPDPSASPQSPPESSEPKAMDPVGPATVPAPVAAAPATEGDLPVDMQPLRIQLGGTKRVYQCRVEGCREGPSTSHAAICSHIRRVHLGMWSWCALSAINLSSTRMPLGITKRDTSFYEQWGRESTLFFFSKLSYYQMRT